MRILDIANPFHSNHMLPIDTDNGRQTSIDRSMIQLSRRWINMRYNLYRHRIMISYRHKLSRLTFLR